MYLVCSSSSRAKEKDAKELPERNEATNERTGGGGGGIDRAFCPPNTTSTTLIA